MGTSVAKNHQIIAINFERIPGALIFTIDRFGGARTLVVAHVGL